jgi:hypothetical protein
LDSDYTAFLTSSTSGCFTVANYTSGSIPAEIQITQMYRIARFDASLSNPIYGNVETVQPPALQFIPQIRF